jgi:hypothetical protein
MNESGRSGWQPNQKTPFLNFNMQYLIRKRKAMTPSLGRGIGWGDSPQRQEVTNND